MVELRCHNSFNEKIYTDIINYLNKYLPQWKSTGFIPVADAVSILNWIDELSGGSQFWSEEVELRVEDAVFEIQEIIRTLAADCLDSLWIKLNSVHVKRYFIFYLGGCPFISIVRNKILDNAHNAYCNIIKLTEERCHEWGGIRFFHINWF